MATYKLMGFDPTNIRSVLASSSDDTQIDTSLHIDGGLRCKSREVSSYPYTVVAGDYLISCGGSGARTINLPAVASNSGRIVIIKDETGNAGSGTITIDGNGNELIDGSATLTLTENRGAYTLICTGSQWVVAQKYSTSGGGGGASALNDLSDVSYSSGDLTISSLDTIAGTDMTIASASATAAGSGFSNAAKCETKIIRFNDYILTTIAVDIEGILTMGENGQVLGNAGGPDNAYITKITTAKNGYIYRAEMACIETPVNGMSDIDLVADRTARAAGFEFDTVWTEEYILVPGNTWHAGEEEKSQNGAGTSNAVPSGLDNYYLYLTAGNDGGGWTNVYSAGKFIIKLYGATF